MTHPTITSDFARSRLEEAVRRGTAHAGPVIQRVLDSQPQDAIVRSDALQYGFDDASRLMIAAGATDWTLHPHAQQQLLERAGGNKFAAYVRELLVEPEPWKRELVLRNLAELSGHARERWLVRTIGREARGVLSSKFRRLDCRPLLDAFIGEASALGAVPYDGVAGELRSSVRAILPTIVEPVPGEAMVYGMAWTNSDYGRGGYDVSLFGLRLVCLNGMVGASQIKAIHLGKRLPDNIELSRRTYELDTMTMASTTRDTVRAALGPSAIAGYSDLIRKAAVERDLAATWTAVGKILTKGELDNARAAFDGPDLINLPAGHSPWRLSNALSWIANADDVKPERKLEIQELAGAVIDPHYKAAA